MCIDGVILKDSILLFRTLEKYLRLFCLTLFSCLFSPRGVLTF